MKMTVKEYAKIRGITVQAAYKKIKTHKQNLQGHIEKIGGAMELDEVAIKILDGEWSAVFFPKEKDRQYVIDVQRNEIKSLENTNQLLKKALGVVSDRNKEKNIEIEKLEKENKELRAEIERLKNNKGLSKLFSENSK